MSSTLPYPLLPFLPVGPLSWPPRQRVVVYRILPALTGEFVNPDMVPFVLPNVLLIAEECTKDEYIRLVLPDLTPVFKQQEPIQVEPAATRSATPLRDRVRINSKG